MLNAKKSQPVELLPIFKDVRLISQVQSVNMYLIYGIPNCDTVKKAITWLNQHNIPYAFHNYKKEGISKVRLETWCKQAGWETLLNKKGTTWRKADPKTQATLHSQKSVINWLSENTSAIKRPLLEKDNKVLAVGFEEAVYQKIFKIK